MCHCLARFLFFYLYIQHQCLCHTDWFSLVIIVAWNTWWILQFGLINLDVLWHIHQMTHVCETMNLNFLQNFEINQKNTKTNTRRLDPRAFGARTWCIQSSYFRKQSLTLHWWRNVHVTADGDMSRGRFECRHVSVSGTNVDAARDILEKSGLAIQTGDNFEDAAMKAVASLKQWHLALWHDEALLSRCHDNTLLLGKFYHSCS